MSFLRVREALSVSPLRRLTATVLSGLVVSGVFSSSLSVAPSFAKPPRTRTERISDHAVRDRTMRYVQVKVATARLRTGPDDSRKLATLLDAGQTARLLSERDGWLKVQLSSGKTGWIKANLVKVHEKQVAVVEPVKKPRAARAKPTRPVSRIVRRPTPAKPAPVPPSETDTPETVNLASIPRQRFLRATNLRPIAPDEETREVLTNNSDAKPIYTEEPATLAPAPSTSTASRSSITLTLEPTEEPSVEPLPEETESTDSSTVISDEATTESATNVPVVDERGQQIVRSALSYRGAPYRMGASGRNGVFDCSSFVRFVLNKYGIRLPRTAAEQYRLGTPVTRQDLRKGDIVFFKNTYRRGISHVGIYIGDGLFVHAANTRSGVKVTSLSDPYYSRHYAGAKRVK